MDAAEYDRIERLEEQVAELTTKVEYMALNYTCYEHKRFPCEECGTSHSVNGYCGCYFCTQGKG